MKQQVSNPFVASIDSGHENEPTFLQHLAETIKRPGSRGSFALVLASTKTSDIDGISAAGISAEARRLTPAIDAEALLFGHPRGNKQLPVSPKGIVSPVVLTRAMVHLSGLHVTLYDCGMSSMPDAPVVLVDGRGMAEAVHTGTSLPRKRVEQLFKAGINVGRHLPDECDYVIMAECVPGGTTTGLAVLTALGHQIDGWMSSSLPDGNHVAKTELVRKGLVSCGYAPGRFQKDPLLAVAAVGDGMQAFAAGLAISASKQIPVVLAGGTQMIAVYELATRLTDSAQAMKNVGVVTTKWVAFDQSADCPALAAALKCPVIAACPDFTQSKHPGLQAYEEGNVKEGVGAGGAMLVAYLQGHSPERILQEIDGEYERMVLGN